MKLARYSSFLSCTLCLLAFASHGSEPTPDHFDRLFAPWNTNNTPGAAVVVVKDGKVAFLHGYGCANLEHRIAITPDTVFDAASVAKQFTGLAIAMLVEKGKLSLDDDIRKHLPDIPDFGRPITVRHLLHHTSGLRDWPETLTVAGKSMSEVIDFQMILEMVRCQRELDFLPGEAHLYSNTGYNLLAAAMAKVTGESFRRWMQTNLFLPLGMNQTHICDDPDEIVFVLAEPYAPAGGGAYRREVSQLAAPGSSSLMITARDMSQWLLNFETMQVGGKRAIDAMLQPGKLNNGKEVQYGFGIGLGEYRHARTVSHTGGWAGYRSAVLRFPEQRLGMAILSNSSDLDAPGLARKVADLYLGASAKKPAPEAPAKPALTTKPDSSKWEAYIGTYRLGPGWLLSITREGDQLMTQATREAKFPMTPVSATSFQVEAYGTNIEFAPSDSGSVTQLVYRGIHAPKLIVPEVTPAYLAAYAGDYWSDELKVVYRIELRDGQLRVRQPFRGWTPLTPTTVDRFDSAFGFTLEFTRNAGTPASEMKISGGRVRNLRFTRIALP